MINKKLPIIDFITFGCLALLGLVGAVIATCYTKDTGALVTSWGVAGSMLLILAIIILRWKRSAPDYYNKCYGIAVWCDNDKFLYSTKGREDLKHMLILFLDRLPVLIKTRFPGDAIEQSVTKSALCKMLYGSGIEWRTEPVSLFSKSGWAVQDKAGLQQGKNIACHWQGSFIKSALCHELLHMIDEVILLRKPDYKHANKHYWGLVNELKAAAFIQYGSI